MFGDEDDIPWSAYRSQFLAQDDNQVVVALEIVSRSPVLKIWNENWPQVFIANRVQMVRMLAPAFKNWTLAVDGFNYTYILNKFMAHVTGLSKQEIIMCA